MTAKRDARGAWRHLPTVWAVLVTLLVLGPVLGPGFVLSYDMVWVPDLALRSDALGLSPALPRAVPSDAVVALVDEVLPGMLLQKLVLAGTLVLAGVGIARLVPGSVTAQLVAVTCYLWNPFVAERLWIGHWPVLLGYAVLPWCAAAALRYRKGTGSWGAVAIWLVLGSLSPSAGLSTGVMALACGVRWSGWRSGDRSNLRLLASVLAANAPWLVAGWLHADTATSTGASVFALQGEGSLPPALAALGLGGIWNSEVVPASREGALAWVSLAGLLLLAGLGARAWWTSSRGGLALPLVACWVIGVTLAVLPAVAPDVVDQLAGALPGAGVWRDSARFLALCAPLLALLVAAGVDMVLRRVHQRGPQLALAAAMVLFPVMVMPDLAWGVGGALRPTQFPSSLMRARAVVEAAEQSSPGDVLILPFTSYRAPAWNDHRKVFAPMGRVLTPNDLTSDDLSVSGVVLPGQDPRGPQVRAALALPDAESRTRALLELGVQFVSVDEGPGVELEGQELYADDDVRVLQLAGTAVSRTAPWSWRVALGVAWAAWLGLVVMGVVDMLRRSRRRDASGRTRG